MSENAPVSYRDSSSDSKPLRVLIYGAGAIGTYIGGSLALGGHHVVFLETPRTRKIIEATGLRLNIQGRLHLLPKPLLADSLPDAFSFGPFDLTVFALKSFDTAAALEEMRPYAAQLPSFLCLQNGVENESAIASLLGENRVISGTVTSAVNRQAAGDIVLEQLRGVGIASGHPLSKLLAQVFNDCGLNARLYPSAAGMKWSKLLTNLLSNATSAILGMTPKEVFEHTGLYRLEVHQLREALEVMHRSQIPVVDLPGTPVRLLAFSVQKLPLGLSRSLLQKPVSRGRGAKMPSFFIDLHSGRGQSEVDFLNGAVVRSGARVGFDTPINRLLTEVLTQLTQGIIPLDRYFHRPEALLAAWRHP